MARLCAIAVGVLTPHPLLQWNPRWAQDDPQPPSVVASGDLTVRCTAHTRPSGRREIIAWSFLLKDVLPVPGGEQADPARGDQVRERELHHQLQATREAIEEIRRILREQQPVYGDRSAGRGAGT